MGFTRGVYGATDASGWSGFTPSGTPQYGFNNGPPASGTTMVLYCSSSLGIDPAWMYCFNLSINGANVAIGDEYTDQETSHTVRPIYQVSFGNQVVFVPVSGGSLPSSGILNRTWGSSSSTLVLPYTSRPLMSEYIFTLSGTATVKIGDSYLHNGQTFFVVTPATNGNKITCTGTGAPTNSGTLTRISGTGTSSINFTSNTTFNAAIQGSLSQPLRSLYGLALRMRPGSPDWGLLKKDDIWIDQVVADDGVSVGWSMYGKSDTELGLLAAYDPATPTLIDPPTGGARPLIKSRSTMPTISFGGYPRWVAGDRMAFVGVEFYNYDADPFVAGGFDGRGYSYGGTAAISMLNPTSMFLIENCKFRCHNMAFQPQGGVWQKAGDIIFRRSVIHSCWADGMDGSPASLIGNMYIEESVVNRSGWINTTGVGSDKRMDWRGVTANSTTPAIITGTVGQPLVITWPNSAARHGSGNYIFNSPGGNIQYGQVQEQIESFPAGVWYYAYNNDFNSFNISTVSISRQGDVHSSTLVTNITTGDLKVGYGVWRNDNQATVPTGTVINSISPDFTVTGNLTQDNTVITGFSNTTGIYIGSVVHGAHVWANVTAVTATTLTVDQPPSSTVIGESMLVSPNAFVMNNSAVFTGSTYLTFIPTPDFVKFSGNEVSPNVLTQMIIGPNGRLHNLYFNGTLIVGDPGSNPGPLYVRGNILSQEGSPGAIQFRAGTNMEDNAFLLEVAGHNCGNPEPNRDNYVTNNVYMDPLENYPSTYVQACSIGMTDYNSDRFNLSVTHLSGNIIAHNLSPTTTNTLGHLCEIADGTFCNYSNNIIYDWGLETDIPHSQGGVVSGTITAGGFGYTATSSAVTGISLDGSMTTALNGAGDVILKLATIPQAIAWFGRIYITGTNIPEIDNKTWGCVWQWGAASNYDQSHICLTGSHPIASLAGWSGGGTAWFPVTGANVDGTLFKYDYYYFTYDTTSPTGPAPGGGNYRSGTGASSQFIVGPGGAIVDVTLGGSDHWNGGASLMQPGQNFRVNEIITAPIPGGSGFKFRLDKVSQVIDQGGNVFRRLGNPHSSWPHPEYTTGTYMDSVTGTGGHKTIDFINAAMDNEKRNWNPALTANKGHNPYIRAAFGVGIYVPPIILSPALLPPGSVNVPYSQLVTAANGTAPYTFAITAGALPNGLILDSNGLIHGTPTLAGNFNVTITATDAVSATGFTAYSMNIDPNQPQQGYHRIALTVTAG